MTSHWQLSSPGMALGAEGTVAVGLLLPPLL